MYIKTIKNSSPVAETKKISADIVWQLSESVFFTKLRSHSNLTGVKRIRWQLRMLNDKNCPLLLQQFLIYKTSKIWKYFYNLTVGNNFDTQNCEILAIIELPREEQHLVKLSINLENTNSSPLLKPTFPYRHCTYSTLFVFVKCKPTTAVCNTNLTETDRICLKNKSTLYRVVKALIILGWWFRKIIIDALTFYVRPDSRFSICASFTRIFVYFTCVSNCATKANISAENKHGVYLEFLVKTWLNISVW